jgi:hypothetical protein
METKPKQKVAQPRGSHQKGWRVGHDGQGKGADGELVQDASDRR